MTAFRGYLTTEEVADLLGVGRKWVAELVALGRLEAVRVGRALFVSSASLRRLRRRPRGRPRKAKAPDKKKGV